MSRRQLLKLLPLAIVALLLGGIPAFRAWVELWLPRPKVRMPVARQVVFPLFEIHSMPTIRLTDIKSRRYQLLDRSNHVARLETQAAEDDKIFKALDQLGTG